MSKPAVLVRVTGAAGQMWYANLFRIPSGEMSGKDQPLHSSTFRNYRDDKKKLQTHLKA